MDLQLHKKNSSVVSINRKSLKEILSKYKTTDEAYKNKENIKIEILELIKQQKKFNERELLQIKKHINNTIDCFFRNKAFGKGMISNLKNILFNMYFFPCIPATNPNIINQTKSTEVKNHSYRWFYNAYINNCKFCLKEKLIIPFKDYVKDEDIDFIEGFKNMDEKKFFNIVRETLILKEEDFATIPTFFLNNPEFFYVKIYIDKYFFKINSKIDTAIEKIFKTPIGYFFVIKEKMLSNFYTQSKIFFYGDTENFIKIQNKLKNLKNRECSKNVFLMIEKFLKETKRIKKS